MREIPSNQSRGVFRLFRRTALYIDYNIHKNAAGLSLSRVLMFVCVLCYMHVIAACGLEGENCDDGVHIISEQSRDQALPSQASS